MKVGKNNMRRWFVICTALWILLDDQFGGKRITWRAGLVRCLVALTFASSTVERYLYHAHVCVCLWTVTNLSVSVGRLLAGVFQIRLYYWLCVEGDPRAIMCPCAAYQAAAQRQTACIDICAGCHHEFFIVLRCDRKNCEKRLLASLCLSVKFIFDIWIYIFRKSVEEIQVLLKSNKNNRYFTWEPIHIFDHISLISS
jgi:hypothetical protein